MSKPKHTKRSKISGPAVGSTELVSSLYRCNMCKTVVSRASTKKWIPSCCTSHEDVTARLYLIQKATAAKWCKHMSSNYEGAYCYNGMDISRWKFCPKCGTRRPANTERSHGENHSKL